MKSSLVKISHTYSTFISADVILQALTSFEHSIANRAQMTCEYKVIHMNQHDGESAPNWGKNHKHLWQRMEPHRVPGWVQPQEAEKEVRAP